MTHDCAGVTDAIDKPQLDELTFSWHDYVVFAISLTIPLGIGIFYFFYKRKQQSTESILLGDRSLNVFAVGMSIVASLLNGIFIIGFPAEMHYHGVKMTYMLITLILMTVVGAHFFIPHYHQWKFTSAYEVRSTVQNMIQTAFFVSTLLMGLSSWFNVVGSV